MFPLLNIFLLTSIDPIKNFVSLKTYISENAQIHCRAYFINEEISNFLRVKVIERNKKDFFEYLDSIGVAHDTVGGYIFFYQKAKK